MAQPNRKEELLAAWRALTGNSEQEGWRTIPISHKCACHLQAGRHFPGNEEALIIGFSSSLVVNADQLPQGHGFIVSKGKQDDKGDHTWITLRRQTAGSLELFSMMADDIVSTLEGLGASTDERLYGKFLARIKAWQEFMKRGNDGVLGAEAEIGLVGELETLMELISVGVSCSDAVEAWQGPLDGVHDFVFGTGAIEVKTTVSASGFPATVGSLEQLDDLLVRPIFLAGVKLAMNASGRTLPELVDELRGMMFDDHAALSDFNIRLLHGGFFDIYADRYSRRFFRTALRLLKVTTEFPRITKGNVAVGIINARYEIDLDLVQSENVRIEDALRQLGVTA